MTKLKLIIVMLGTLCSGSALAADLALLLTHDSRTQDADGVTRSTHFQERVVRQDGTLWVERLVSPLAHEQAAHADEKEHHHLDVDGAARWISRDGKGQVRLRLVNPFEKVVVNVGAGDFDAVGFDGDWDRAWHLLDPRQLKQMQVVSRAAPAGARWYEGRRDGRYLRVLWDEARAFPLQVESGTDNGLVRRAMRASVQPLPKVMPWQALQRYAEKEFSDYLD